MGGMKQKSSLLPFNGGKIAILGGEGICLAFLGENVCGKIVVND